MEGLTHPAADSARRYLAALPAAKLEAYEGHFRATALRTSADGMGYRLLSDLQQHRAGGVIPDLDALGLAWVIRSIEQQLAAAQREESAHAG